MASKDKLHVHWAGMHLLRVSQLLGSELTEDVAKKPLAEDRRRLHIM